MSRKVLITVVVLVAAGATGYGIFAQQPPRQVVTDFRPAKPGKKWQYCTLSEQRLDKDRVAVFVEGVDATIVCNGGWIEAAEQLGLKLAPEHPRKNEMWGGRKNALDQMGELGWELVSVHRGEFERTVWVFKREL